MEFSSSQIRKMLDVNPRTFANWVPLIEPLRPARGKGTRAVFSEKNLVELGLIQILFEHNFDRWAVKLVLDYLDEVPEEVGIFDLDCDRTLYLKATYRISKFTGDKPEEHKRLSLDLTKGREIRTPEEAYFIINLKKLRGRLAEKLGEG